MIAIEKSFLLFFEWCGKKLCNFESFWHFLTFGVNGALTDFTVFIDCWTNDRRIHGYFWKEHVTF